MNPNVPPDGPQLKPVCYRHRDRETYVRCVRCDRPICPDCMRAASVGFQCPDCVREGNRSVRGARTTFGGKVSGNDRAVSIGLIGINVAVFLLVGARNPAALTQGFVTPVHVDFAFIGNAVAAGDYYRALTSGFLHYGPVHLLLNMYALWLFGPELERVFGRARFLGIYVFATLGGSALEYLIGNPAVAGAGASGAIFGLFGAYFITARKIGMQTGGLVVLIVFNLAFGFIVPNIGWQAHIGGLITGTALAAVFAYAPRGPQRTMLQLAGAVVLGVLLVAVFLARTTSLTA